MPIKPTQGDLDRWHNERHQYEEYADNFAHQIEELSQRFCIDGEIVTKIAKLDISTLQSDIEDLLNNVRDVNEKIVSAVPGGEIEIEEIAISASLCKKLHTMINRLKKILEIYAPQSETKDTSQTENNAFVNIGQNENSSPVDNNQNQFAQLLQMHQELMSMHVNGNVGSNQTSVATKIKLPKLTIEPFSGNILHWQQFWDNFNTSIHSDETISDVAKYGYLKSFLRGSALRALDNIPITGNNYEVALKILTDKYDDKRVTIQSHTQKLINLSNVKHKGQLDVFYNNIQSHIRALKGLGESCDNSTTVETILSKLVSEDPQMKRFHRELRKGLNGRTTKVLDYVLDKIKEEIKLYQNERGLDYGQQQRDKSFNKPMFQANINSTGNSNRFNSGQNANFRNVQTSGFQRPIQSQQQQRFGAQNRQYNGSTSTAHALVAQTVRSCAFCDENHSPMNCQNFSTAHLRKERLKELRKCFRCLGGNHMLGNCTRNISCINCSNDWGKTHHSSICRMIDKQETVVKTVQEIEIEKTGVLQLTQAENKGTVVLSTAYVDVCKVGSDKKVKCRFLLDSGSQRMFITKKCSDKLELKPCGKETISVLGFAQKKAQTMEVPLVEFNAQLKDGTYMTMQASVNDKVTGLVKKIALDPKKYEILKHNDLAEPLSEQTENVEVDILLSNEYYYKIVEPSQIIKLDENLQLVNTKFGFMLAGRALPGDNIIDKTKSIENVNFLSSSDDMFVSKFEPDLERLWSFNDMGIKESGQMKDDDIAQEHFNSTVKYDSATKRYEVSYPYKDEDMNLPNNYGLAFSRLKGLLTRLSAHPELIEKYDEVFKEHLKLGIIEEVTPDMECNEKVYYVPHHCVIRPDKATTKIRVVYDASSKANPKYNSLNDMLYRGPVGLEDICGLLMRFRLDIIAIICDIEKAFLQIDVAEKDRDVNRLLWIRDIKNPTTDKQNLVTYRFARVGFGVISSPFLLMGVLRHHLNHTKINSEIAKEMAQNLYVDNVIVCKSSIKKAMTFYNASKEILKQASMNLREWSSNSKEFIDMLPECDRAKGDIVKVLGMKWDLKNDLISLTDPKLDEIQVDTKRHLVKAIAKVFDPLGYFCPFTAESKLLLQSMWKQKLGWDDKLPTDIKKDWERIVQILKKIPDIKLPRIVGPITNDQQVQLHCFTDASMKAYAVALYLRIKTGEKVETFLIFAKNRLAPVKEVTLPRLELMGTTLGASLTKFVKEQLRCKIERTVLWSDSQCVLGWLKTKKVLPTFVKNRVNSIKEIENIEKRYVPSEQNPADIPTKPNKHDLSINNNLWWKGPKWLKQDEKHWPKSPISYKIESELETAVVQYKRKVENAPFDIDITRFSSLNKLINVTALVRKACFIWLKRLPKMSKNDTKLTIDEISWSKIKWESYTQNITYSNIKDTLLGKRKEKDPMIKQLGLYLDKEGLIRCKGRLQYADVSEDMKYPKLLPKHNYFSQLIIEHFHKQLLHTGANQTLAHIRHLYWIPQGRREVQRVLRKCTVCRTLEGGPYQPPPAPPWPIFRVAVSKPFECTGVDYMGPLFVKNNDTQIKEKVWIALFTCASTRAVHLDVVTDMTAQVFIDALKRFIARRGRPKLMISDNAKQFKLAEKSLKILWKHVTLLQNNEIQDYVAQQGIEWKFITEMAPWMGGFYERLIGTVKRSLVKTVGRKLLTLAQLQTLVIEIEAIVNTRPLTQLTEDIDDTFLTPAHLLFINTKLGMPNIVLDTDPEFTLTPNSTQTIEKTWHENQKLLNYFWLVWRNDYLLSLRERGWDKNKNTRNTSNDTPKIGTIVLIKENLPRAQWKRAKIENLVAGRDGLYRTANLLLPNHKIMRRPIKLLVPLETSGNQDFISNPVLDIEQIGQKKNEDMDDFSGRSVADV